MFLIKLHFKKKEKLIKSKDFEAFTMGLKYAIIKAEH
jgi:hypothetical protein